MPPLKLNDALPVLKILPINSASGSAGSIHDDEKAKEMGYRGGFVPGVTVLGYMTAAMQNAYGPGWQPGSTFRGRLRRPVYEGAEIVVEGVVVEEAAASNGHTTTVELRVVDDEGTVAAVATATCKAGQ